MGNQCALTRPLVWALLLVGALLLCGRCLLAQEEEFFKPLIVVPPTKTPLGGQVVYSFSRLDPDFTALCLQLEQEGRRDRLVRIAEAGLERDKNSITVRSFWKMVVGACGRLGPKPTPAPKPDKAATRAAKAEAHLSKKATSDSSEGNPPSQTSSAPGADLAGKTPVAPTPTKAAQGERYPSVVLLDLASRLSSSLYESDSGEGPTAQMLYYFAKTVRETPDLTTVEREYYDILLAYLVAAWEGRVDSSKLPTPTPSSDLRELLDF